MPAEPATTRRRLAAAAAYRGVELARLRDQVWRAAAVEAQARSKAGLDGARWRGVAIHGLARQLPQRPAIQAAVQAAAMLDALRLAGALAFGEARGWRLRSGLIPSLAALARGGPAAQRGGCWRPREWYMDSRALAAEYDFNHERRAAAIVLHTPPANLAAIRAGVERALAEAREIFPRRAHVLNIELLTEPSWHMSGALVVLLTGPDGASGRIAFGAAAEDASAKSQVKARH